MTMSKFRWFQDQGPKTATTTHAQTGSPKGGGRKFFVGNPGTDSWSGQPKVTFRTARGNVIPDSGGKPKTKPQGWSWRKKGK